MHKTYGHLKNCVSIFNGVTVVKGIICFAQLQFCDIKREKEKSGNDCKYICFDFYRF